MLDHELLKQMVLKVIQQLEEEHLLPPTKQKACYFILPESWQEDYFARLGALSVPCDYQAIFVLPKLRYNDYYIQKLKELFPACQVIEQERASEEQWEESLTIFPFPSRELVAKIALCMEDSFETRWIGHCFSQGIKVVMLQSGMKPLSGKEPKAYRMKLEHYIRTLSEFEIELNNPFILPEQPKLVPEKTKTIIKAQQKKRVITEADLITCQKDGRLTLQEGDIITMLAKEKASELGIQINRV